MTPPPLPPRFRPGSAAHLRHALLVWLAFYLLGFLSRLVLFPYLGTVGGVLAFALCYGGILGIGMIGVGRLRARDLGYTLDGWRREVVLGVAGFVGISVLLLLWVLVLHGPGEVATLLGTIGGYTPMQHLTFLGIGLLASSAEETLFRGYLQPALMSRCGAIAGLLLTMVLFQIVHYNDWPTLDRLVSLSITGLGFGVLRWRDRPLIASCVAHTVLWVVWGTA